MRGVTMSVLMRGVLVGGEDSADMRILVQMSAPTKKRD